MQTALAYIFALLIAPGVGSIPSALLGAALVRMRITNDLTQFAGGFAQVTIASWIAASVFGWLGVAYGWIALACVFTPLALNDGRRFSGASGRMAAAESIHASGTLAGGVVALLTI